MRRGGGEWRCVRSLSSNLCVVLVLVTGIEGGREWCGLG